MPERRPPGRSDHRWSDRRFPDPERSADPEIQTVLTALRTLPRPTPRPEFRSELRTQLVAIAPRLVAEGVSPVAATRDRSPLQQALGRLRPRRPLAVLTSTLAVLVLLLGGAIWVSGRSVPGDALYGVKRANENVQLALTRGDAPRGGKRLDRAETRVGEVLTLWTDSVPATPAPVVAAGAGSTAGLMADTLADADAEIRNGSRVLGEKAVRENTAAPLTEIIAWAPGQIARLGAIAAAIPPSALHDRAVASQALAKRALERATALEATLGCQCQTAAGTDDLGPLPCTACASGGAPGGPSSSAPATSPGAPTPTEPTPSGPSATPGPTPSAAPTPGETTPATAVAPPSGPSPSG